MIIFAILLFLLLTPWQLRLDFGRELKLSLGKFGLFFSLPKTSGKRDGLGEVLWEKVILYKKLYREGGVGIAFLALNLELGTGDAAATALALGSLWAVVGAISPFLPRNAEICAQPLYGPEPSLRVWGRCIFRLVPGYIIIVWIKNLYEDHLKGGANCG